MFNLFTAFNARIARLAPLASCAAEPVLGQDDFDEHVWTRQAHLSELERAEHLAEAAKRQSEQARIQAIWDALEDEGRWTILETLDRLNARGGLEDHMFFDQWLASRMDGYVGD
ncbi:hypothetical protein [Caulobacter sp. Root343]|nr:hypothetical protein [Caulobacter sp. Root343]KQV54684.1 hypothetical protein ASC62_23125 [Caulobacter sp. Root342]KQV64027.1 hypothetical protein ASC70_19545 [Caulobacter sp. Root343]